MREHTYLKHTNCSENYCAFCDGGLAACTVCGGMEGSLTTECCGRRITEDEERRIYNEGTLDFRDGEWREEPNYPRSNNLDHPKWAHLHEA